MFYISFKIFLLLCEQLTQIWYAVIIIDMCSQEIRTLEEVFGF